MHGLPARVRRLVSRSQRLGLAVAAAGAIGLAAATAAAAPGPDPVARPMTAADCKSLLHQFDVASAAHHDDPRAAAARASRDQGAAACEQKHYADGVHLIRRALHDIGVKPVKIVSPSPAH